MRGRGEYLVWPVPREPRKVKGGGGAAGEHGPGACRGKRVQPRPGGADIRRNEGAPSGA